MDIKGRDLITGLPKPIIVTETQIREALKEKERILVDKKILSIEEKEKMVFCFF